MNHITEPIEQFYTAQSFDPSINAKLPRKYTVTGGIRIPIGPQRRNSRELSITPALLFKKQGEFTQVDGGVYINAEPMVFGLWYRHQDAMIALIGIKTGPFSFGYSFDYTISDLSLGVSGGSHEVAIVMEFEQYPKRRSRKHKSMPCPRF